MSQEIDTEVDDLISNGNSSALEELLLRVPDKPEMLFTYLSKFNPHSDTVCRIFLQQGMDPNGLENTTSSLLLRACFNNMEAAARTLIKHGADVNFKNFEGVTPLICSVLNNNLPLTQYLYVHGASLLERTMYLKTPLRIACDQGYLPLVEFIHKKVGVGTNSYATLILAYEENMDLVYYFLRHIDPASLYTAYNYSMRFSIPEISYVLDSACAIYQTKSLDDAIKHLHFNSFDMGIWYHHLPYKKEWIDHVEESKRTEIACYLALYEEADTMQRFRAGECVDFSHSRLRGIARPYGARPIRNRIVRYLVSPKPMRLNYSSSCEFWNECPV
jgi:hypothetical protein